jgi:hypothetical protein
MSSKVSSVNEAKAPATSLFDSYTVTMEFTGQLMGGVPKHPDMINSWLSARAPTHAPPDGTPLPELAVAVQAAVSATENDENKVWTGFKSDDAGILYVDGYHLKAHLKDLANILKDYLGVKAFKSKVADRLFVKESALYLLTEGPLGEGTVLREPAGYWEHPVHIN